MKIGDKVWVKVSRDKERPGTLISRIPVGNLCVVELDSHKGEPWEVPESDVRFFSAEIIVEITGTKNDDGKCRLELIPPEALTSLGDAFTFGAKKYADDNWAKGFKWRRLIGAAQRHINAFNSGEDKDQESGLSHIDHALACLAMLVAHEKGGLGEDDRRRITKISK